MHNFFLCIVYDLRVTNRNVKNNGNILGDTIQRLKDNSIAISPRSPCMSEHNDGSSDEKQSLSIIDVDADISQTSGKASNCGEDNIESKEPNKRKRRRTRKRKSNRPIATDSPAVQTYLPPSRSNVNFTKGCPSMHIKFVENPDDSSLMVVDAVNEETKTELDIQSITIESDTEEIEIKIENIMKSPLMNELLPKAGDIISFKVSNPIFMFLCLQLIGGTNIMFA